MTRSFHSSQRAGHRVCFRTNQTGAFRRRRGRLRTLESVPSLLVVVKANPKDARERERERHARGVKEKTR